MKAAMLCDVGQIEVVEIDTPPCPEDGVLIEIKTCSICSTDVHMYHHGHRDLVLPRILGHELSGKVAEVGDATEGVRKGERVQLAPGVACGMCRPCRRGHQNMCEHMRIFGFHLDGGFAEYVSVPGRALKAGCLVRLPHGLDYERAALAEPLACCINAQDAVNVGNEDRVVVIGAGPVGCLNAMLARTRGASCVVLIDKDPHRLEMAEGAGADHLLNTSDADAVHTLMEGGADVVIIACRDASATKDAIRMVGKNGRVCLFSGAPSEHMPLSIDTNELHYTQKMLAGAYGCTSLQNQRAIELIASRMDVSWLITKHISLEDVVMGIEATESRRDMKVVIC